MIDKLQGNYEPTENTLQNPSFVYKAPAAVVDKKRVKLAEMQGSLERVQGQREKIARL